MAYPCACCGYLPLDEPPGSFDLCPVCFWQDDPVVSDDPATPTGGPNAVSLEEARRNYRTCGACEPRFVRNVRAPQPEEAQDTE